MTKHTPMPWIVVDNGDDTEYGAFTVAPDSEEACFAPIADFKLAESGCMESDGNGGSQEYAHYSIDREECLANANLCAASPELLLACQMVLNDVSAGMLMGCVLTALNNAINKALKGDDR